MELRKIELRQEVGEGEILLNDVREEVEPIYEYEDGLLTPILKRYGSSLHTAFPDNWESRNFFIIRDLKLLQIINNKPNFDFSKEYNNDRPLVVKNKEGAIVGSIYKTAKQYFFSCYTAMFSTQEILSELINRINDRFEVFEQVD